MTFITSYISWHYGAALPAIVKNWKNSILFVLHFFSVLLLFRTLFSPWRRLTEKYKGGLDFENIVGFIVVNTIMRIVGFIVRVVVIFVSLIVLAVVIVGGIFFFVAWILAPLVLPLLFSVGFALL